MSDSNPQAPFGNALLTTIRELRGQPPLLVTVAMGIVLASVAVTAGDAARTIAIPLLAFLGAGLVAWVYTDARRAQHGKDGVFRNTRFGGWSHQEDVKIKTGDVHAPPGGRIEENFVAGVGSRQKHVKIEHGDIT
jgi:hypothetical protein